MARRLQEGIYYQGGVRPGLFFAVTFLALREGRKAHEVRADLKRLWGIYADLKKGITAEHANHPVPSGNLTVLLGYGPNFFGLEGTVNRPPQLAPRNQFLSPQAIGGGPLLIASGLSYAPDISRNVATEAIVVQFIADSQLAVNRAVVETWAALDPSLQSDTALSFGGFFDGFSRDDGRSWIGFHDGISNMRSGLPRENALRIKTGANTNGSTMCFLRLEVDLPAWRRLSLGKQELMVGRDKLSGCPFSQTAVDGKPAIKAGCPVQGTADILANENVDYRMPDSVSVADPLRQSHVQRANLQHSSETDRVDSLRVFRQGYEFLESLSNPPGFRLGLNFVSFQDSPDRIVTLLTRKDWLGQTNFGGDPLNPLPGMVDLLRVRAAAIFLVPPADDALPFPGDDFFA
jgi:deferrochelatase/peroxidase EfeB